MVDKPAPPFVRIEVRTPAHIHAPASETGGAQIGHQTGGSAERRRANRRGVRLTWGKALDVSDKFLCECLVVNRSQGGARLRLARKIALPTAFHFFDDSEGALYAAQVVWRQDDVVGCRVELSPLRDKEDVIKRMSGPYYAI